MGTYRYTAINATGQRVSGELAAASQPAVLAELESRRLSPISIDEASPGVRLRRGVSKRKLAQSYQQLSDLTRAGVPLLRALRLLGGRSSQARLAEAYRELADAVAEGEAFADAMRARPAMFPDVHVAMVRAGEQGGFLEDVLAKLSRLVESQAELRGTILGNLIYPSVLVVFGVAVLGIVFGFFVPMFEPMFARIDRLPPITVFVFACADLVGTYGPITLGVLALAVVGLWRLSKRDDVRLALLRAQMRAPVIGPLTRAVSVARFARLLGAMLANGVGLLAAMRIAKDASGNRLMSDAIEEAAEAVRAGEPLADPLARSGLFDDDVVEMISVGESANNLEQVLATLADTIEGRIGRMLTTAVRLIEPLMLLLIAMIVVVVAMGLILPLTQLSAA